MTPDDKLTFLEDRLAIQDVIALYSMGQDSHQGEDSDILEQWDNVFTEDGTTDYSVAGADPCHYRELAQWMRGSAENPGRMSIYSHWQHMLNLPVISIEGHCATARTDLFATHRLKKEAARLDVFGAFHDQLVKTGNGWRIKHRRLEIYFSDHVTVQE